MSDLLTEARGLARLLKRKKLKIVFAESCTAGAVPATLGQIPGISDVLCGSFVVYRLKSKQSWLKISRGTLRKGSVSGEVSIALARAALRETPEARVAASITGYLGPSAPKGKNGLIFMAVALKQGRQRGEKVSVEITSEVLKAKGRKARQLAASLSLIRMVRSLLT